MWKWNRLQFIELIMDLIFDGNQLIPFLLCLERPFLLLLVNIHIGQISSSKTEMKKCPCNARPLRNVGGGFYKNPVLWTRRCSSHWKLTLKTQNRLMPHSTFEPRIVQDNAWNWYLLLYNIYIYFCPRLDTRYKCFRHMKTIFITRVHRWKHLDILKLNVCIYASRFLISIYYLCVCIVQS